MWECFPPPDRLPGLECALRTGRSSGQLQNIRPFPGFGGSQFDVYEGVGSDNSGQVTLEKRNAKGLYFLATYTYSHALDDTATPLDGGANICRSALVVPVGYEYTNSGAWLALARAGTTPHSTTLMSKKPNETGCFGFTTSTHVR
jgi:hypothetical protein